MFCKEYIDVFLEEADSKSSGSGEHPLEYYDAYKAYLAKFEGKISDFIEAVSIIRMYLLHIIY